MAQITVPSIDFSSLGQLPDVYRQAQSNALRQQTLSNLGNGANGQIDPTALIRSGDMSLAQLGINIQNQQQAQAHQAARDSVADQHWQYTQQHSGDMTDYQRAQLAQNSPSGRAKIAQQYGIDPQSPEGKSFILTGSVPDSLTTGGKPMPVETLGGTKFLVRGPNGYSLLDPSQLAQPQGQPQPQQGQPAPQPSPQSTAQPSPTPSPTPSPVSQPGAEPATPTGQSTPAAAAAPTAAPNPDAVDPQTGRRESYLQSLDPQVRDYIKKVADYEIDPRTTSVRGGMREKLMSAVAHYDPSYNQNDFGARAKAIKDFSTGPQGNIVRSFDVAVDHLDTLQKAATAMQNGDVRTINAIRNKWRNETGSDLPTNFQALVPLVSGEIAKAVIGSNNALSDREELRNNLQAAQSPEQISGVIQGYKALMGGQLKGLKKQYEATTGKQDFESKLRDVTKQELEGKQNSAPNAPIKVSTPDEARQYPKGTHIILPDGSPGIVP